MQIKRAMIIGASGALGNAFTECLLERPELTALYALSRSGAAVSHPRVHPYTLDLLDEQALAHVAAEISADGTVDAVIIATGILHDGEVRPEKSLRDLSYQKLQHVYAINTILPALAFKHFLPLLHKDHPAFCAALSARVGSISDNQLGGWYGYRASKAALNMMIKNASIEMARRYPYAVIVGLHPGTVDSALSKPFQAQVTPDHLFTPAHSATQLLKVMEGLSAEHSGKCFAYDGSEVLP
jgi:NAD(P)-dependent dehydrogenase (short-subunit alcohol dehydrogenase family)